jgi:peptide subunit release factor RF-3
LRDVPIITFVNKLDRESHDSFNLMDGTEEGLDFNNWEGVNHNITDERDWLRGCM